MPPLKPNTWAAVPDPDDPMKLTFWAIGADGKIRDFPAGERWRPVPPQWHGVDHATRGEVRQRWYDQVYFPWRRKVAEAIEADPEGAQARFLQVYPQPETVPAATKRAGAPRRPRPTRTARDILAKDAVQDAQGLIAAALAADGHPPTSIADALGISEATARRRILHGRGLLLIERVKTGRDPVVDGFTAALGRLIELRTGTGQPLNEALRDAIGGIIARRSGQQPSAPNGTPNTVNRRGTQRTGKRAVTHCCDLCLPKRVRTRHHRGRHTDASEQCAECGAGICARHTRWDPERGAWVCTRCARQAA